MMNPSSNKKLIDVACGTGDVGKLFLDNTNKNAEITCVDPNKAMIKKEQIFKNDSHRKNALFAAHQ